MTYGQTPNATKPVKLNRKRKTRASHVESTRTSLIVTAMGEQEEPEAQAALFKHLVHRKAMQRTRNGSRASRPERHLLLRIG